MHFNNNNICTSIRSGILINAKVNDVVDRCYIISLRWFEIRCSCIVCQSYSQQFYISRRDNFVYLSIYFNNDKVQKVTHKIAYERFRILGELSLISTLFHSSFLIHSWINFLFQVTLEGWWAYFWVWAHCLLLGYWKWWCTRE